MKKKHKESHHSSDSQTTPKVALVCDWLTDVGGAEKVLLELHRLFPEAPIYTSKYDPKGINWFKDADIRTGFLQKIPTRFRRILGPLRQRYFSHLDLSEYDLVISVTGAEAKAVKAKNGLHICYCHIPTQYYWQMYNEYLKNPGFGIFNPIVRLFFILFVGPLKIADYRAAKNPDYFVTISEYSKEQIAKYYGREATIIHPPVEVKDFNGKEPIDKIKSFDVTNAYITTSRQVNWKKIDLAVKACLMSQRSLLVIGDGSEHKKLVKLAKGSKHIKFLPTTEKEQLAKYLSAAKGYLFPSLEPFGIAPVEALAAGCPVIAFKDGGSREYIAEGKNGIFFEEQTALSLVKAITEFEKKKFNRNSVAKTATKFSVARFDKEITDFIKKCTKKGKNGQKANQ